MATRQQTVPTTTAPAPQLTVQGALEMVKAATPEAYDILAAMARKDIVALGTDEAFALRDQTGEIRAFKQALTFSEAQGTLIQPVPGGPHVVSAQGYEVWQEASGTCVIFPSEVLVGSEWKANPAVIRDEHNGRILMIYARAVAFRFSSKGIPMVSDWTTIYDTPSYRMIDLLAKAKDKPQAFKLLPIDMRPDKEDGGTWAKYPFDEATALWMNTKHDEALKWLGSIINREKKSIDFAQTFAKRNALKHLSGLQKAPGHTWTISVICWRPTSGNIIKWDATTYKNLQDRAGKMISGDRKEFAQIEMQSGTERVAEDDTAPGQEAETDPEDQPAIDISPGQNGGQEAKSAPEKEPSRAQRNLAEARKEFPEEFSAACKDLGIDPEADHSNGQAIALMNAITTAVDKKIG